MKPVVVLSFALALLTPAYGETPKQNVRIGSTVSEEIVTTSPDGKRTTKLVPATQVSPGDTVVVRLTCVNDSEAPASDIEVSNPVPQHLHLIDVRDGGEPVYSIDGGATFGALKTLRVKLSATQTRPATPADVTHLRWRLAQPLAPHASADFAFAARLD